LTSIFFKWVETTNQLDLLSDVVIFFASKRLPNLWNLQTIGINYLEPVGRFVIEQ